MIQISIMNTLTFHISCHCQIINDIKFQNVIQFVWNESEPLKFSYVDFEMVLKEENIINKKKLIKLLILNCDKFNYLGSLCLYLNVLTKQFISRLQTLHAIWFWEEKEGEKGFHSNLFKSIFNTLFIISCCVEGRKDEETANWNRQNTTPSKSSSIYNSLERKTLRKTKETNEKTFTRTIFLFRFSFQFFDKRKGKKKKKQWNSTTTFCATKYARDNKLKLTPQWTKKKKKASTSSKTNFFDKSRGKSFPFQSTMDSEFNNFWSFNILESLIT